MMKQRLPSVEARLRLARRELDTWRLQVIVSIQQTTRIPAFPSPSHIAPACRELLRHAVAPCETAYAARMILSRVSDAQLLA